LEIKPRLYYDAWSANHQELCYIYVWNMLSFASDDIKRGFDEVCLPRHGLLQFCYRICM